MCGATRKCVKLKMAVLCMELVQCMELVYGIGAVHGIGVWNWCMECEYIQVLKAANTVPLWVASYSRQIETSQIVLTSASTVLWLVGVIEPRRINLQTSNA